MHLSQKRKKFSDFFFAFVSLNPILNIFFKKNDPHSLCIFELRDSEKRCQINV